MSEDQTDQPAAGPLVPRVQGSAVRAYVGAQALRWRAGRAPQGGVPQAEAARFLQQLSQQMPEEQGEAIRQMLAQGRVGARRLIPADGVVFRLPGARIFAIQGLQPFIAPDPPQQQAQGGAEAAPGEGAPEPGPTGEDPLEAAAEAEEPSSPS